MKDFQITHRANGIRRIKQAIDNCDLPVNTKGTYFSNPPIGYAPIKGWVWTHGLVKSKYN